MLEKKRKARMIHSGYLRTLTGWYILVVLTITLSLSFWLGLKVTVSVRFSNQVRLQLPFTSMTFSIPSNLWLGECDSVQELCGQQDEKLLSVHDPAKHFLFGFF